jgi:hypothetical protein
MTRPLWVHNKEVVLRLDRQSGELVAYDTSARYIAIYTEANKLLFLFLQCEGLKEKRMSVLKFNMNGDYKYTRHEYK